jgi:hypothetical protein
VRSAERPDRAFERLDAMAELAMPEFLPARRECGPRRPLDESAVRIARALRRQIGRDR